MNTTQTEFEKLSAGQSQCALILAELQRRPGEWVPMPELWRVSGAFAVHSRIADLRKRGYVIVHKNTHQPDGSIHSFYQLGVTF